ncbi:MAG: hypothetical protein AAFX87_16395 [Bacteroidota bacterium]
MNYKTIKHFKTWYLLMPAFLFGLMVLNGCDDDDESPDPAAPQFIRLLTVDPLEETVSIRNFGTEEVNISSFQLCLGAGQYNILSDYSSITGSPNLAASATVVIDLTSGSEGVTALPDASGGLGLFANNSDFTSSDSEILRDYIQWGAADQNRVSQAVTAGRWDDADNFVTGLAPYTFVGNANNVGASFWAINVPEVIRLVVVDPSKETVSIENLGTTEIDISAFQLCLGPGQYNILSNYSSIQGDLSLTANERVVIDLTSGSEGVTALPDTNGGLVLFADNSDFGSSDPDLLRDYMQWGAANQDRVAQAVAAGRWDSETSFIDGFAPYTLNTTSTDVGTTSWETTSAEDARLLTGFVINAQTPTGNIAKYFAQLPSGAVDVSDGTDFQQFFPVDLFDGAIFNARPDGSAGFSKIMVDGNGDVIEDSFIAVSDAGSFQIAVSNSTTGVFHDRNDPQQITVFNPSNMTVGGNIDMSAGFVPGDIPQRYQTFYFRGDEVFSPIRGNAGAIYDSLIVHIANVSTGTFVASSTINSGPAAPFNDFGQHHLDENGTLYIPDQGDVFTGNPASLHRILSGTTDFDPTYEFNIASTLNPANVFLPIFRGFYYVGNDLAIALVAQDTPQEVIDLVASVGGNPANLSDEQLQQVLGILFASENGRWCEIDLSSMTVTPIAGLPAQSVFSTTVTMEIDGVLYFPITTTSINSLYSYDPQTKATAEVFQLAAGGTLVGVHNLSNNN